MSNEQSGEYPVVSESTEKTLLAKKIARWRSKIAFSLNPTRVVEINPQKPQFFYSLKKQRFLSSSENMNELMKSYNGKKYGNGTNTRYFIAPQPDADDLIETGWYEINPDKDAEYDATERNYECPKYIDLMGNDNFVAIYAPSDRGQLNTEDEDRGDDRPVILSDGHKIIFSCPHNLLFHLKDFFNDPAEKRSLTYYNLDGTPWTFEYEVGGDTQYFENVGIDPRRFLDTIDNQVINRHDIITFKDIGMFNEKLGIYTKRFCNSEHQPKYLRISQYNYIDGIWKENPRCIIGSIAAGWTGAGEGLYWRRTDDKIEAFIEVPANQEYQNTADDMQWSSYSETFPIATWYSEGSAGQNWINYFKERLQLNKDK